MRKGVDNEYCDYELAQNIAKQIVEKINKDTDSTDGSDHFFLSNNFSDKLLDKLSDQDQIKKSLDLYSKFNRDRSLAQWKLKLEAKQQRRIFLKKMIAGAAVAIIVVSLMVFIVDVGNRVDPYFSDVREHRFNTPHLILSNGNNVDLGSPINNIEEDNLIIKKDSERLISYIAIDTFPKGKNIIKYNTIIVPSGYTYSIILEDSTSITLNANSELRYPLKFSENERLVYLKGEAFFSVKKCHKPFVVESSSAIVRVYGTEFTIYNYENGIFETVLLNGSVGVTIKNRDEVMIGPNEKLSLNNQLVNIESVNAQDYIQWKNGKFNFLNQSVERVLCDIGKWYNISFTIPENLRAKSISMFSNKDVDVNNIIKFIEEMLNVKIINEGGGKYVITTTILK